MVAVSIERGLLLMVVNGGHVDGQTGLGDGDRGRGGGQAGDLIPKLTEVLLHRFELGMRHVSSPEARTA